MNWFSTPKRLEVGDAVLNIVITSAILLFAPEGAFGMTRVSWLWGLLVVLPSSFVAGLLSSWLYYRKHDFTCLDPFYIRAWWAVVGGAGAWPICLFFRPAADDFAFILFTFGAGSVLAFHVYRQVEKHRCPQPAVSTNMHASRR